MKNSKVNKSKKTKKNNKKHNRTIKKYVPSIKFLHVNYPIYKAYDFDGKELLPYKMKMEKESGDSCLLENSSWFGDLNVAKEYKTSDRSYAVFFSISLVTIFATVSMFYYLLFYYFYINF